MHTLRTGQWINENIYFHNQNICPIGKFTLRCYILAVYTRFLLHESRTVGSLNLTSPTCINFKPNVTIKSTASDNCAHTHTNKHTHAHARTHNFLFLGIVIRQAKAMWKSVKIAHVSIARYKRHKSWFSEQRQSVVFACQPRLSAQWHERTTMTHSWTKNCFIASSVTRSLGRSVARSLGRSVQPSNHPAIQPSSHPVIRSSSHPDIQSVRDCCQNFLWLFWNILSWNQT